MGEIFIIISSHTLDGFSKNKDSLILIGKLNKPSIISNN
jgi:hypothetical protein